MLAFSNDYYGLIFRATQSVELFCAYVAINLHNKKLNDFLFAWGVIRGKRAKGLISDEEYLNWKYQIKV